MAMYRVELDDETASRLRVWCLKTGLEPEPALADLLGVLLALVESERGDYSVLGIAAQLYALLDDLGLGPVARRARPSGRHAEDG